MSPFSALSILVAFNSGKVQTITQEYFDAAVDRLIRVLEEANNNKHRVAPLITDVSRETE